MLCILLGIVDDDHIKLLCKLLRLFWKMYAPDTEAEDYPVIVQLVSQGI